MAKYRKFLIYITYIKFLSFELFMIRLNNFTKFHSYFFSQKSQKLSIIYIFQKYVQLEFQQNQLFLNQNST